MKRDPGWSHLVRRDNQAEPASPFVRVRDVLGADALREYARQEPAAPDDFAASADGAPASVIDLRCAPGDRLLRSAENQTRLPLSEMLPLNCTSEAGEAGDLLRSYCAAAGKQTGDGAV